MISDELRTKCAGGDDGIRFSRELRARSSTALTVHRTVIHYRFPFESLEL